MSKLLIIKPDGSKGVVNVGPTGSYHDQSKVIWDERVGGSIPEGTYEAMVKVGGKLVVDEVLLKETNDKKLLDSKMSALMAVDLSNDGIVTAVIGRRDTEYLMAEKQAQAYIDAGYKGDTYPYVDSWAMAKAKSEKWSADNIIETANNWRAIQADMRSKRLKAKEDIRNATSTDTIDTIVQQWYAYLDIIKQQLGI